MAYYFATVLPGLENVLEHEIRVKFADATFQSIERGKVYFSSGLPADSFMSLRTADNLYRLIRRFRVGPHKIHLAGIEQELSRVDLSRIVDRSSGYIHFKVNASRTGKHTYSRFDAAEAAARGIAERNSRYVHTADGTHEIEFRLDLDHDKAVFALRLTDASFRYRTEQRSFVRASLRPTIAHALVWLSEPAAADAFIDPCCGSGTIVSERLAYPYGRIDGGDMSAEAANAALQNIGSHEHVRIHRWDARRLPFDAGHADKIVTNLPFGKQIAANEPIPELYEGIFKEMKRVLKPNGFALCLTDAEAALQTAAERIQLNCMKKMTVSLKGLQPSIFLLRKP